VPNYDCVRASLWIYCRLHIEYYQHIDLPQWCFCCFFVFWSFGKIFSCSNQRNYGKNKLKLNIWNNDIKIAIKQNKLAHKQWKECRLHIEYYQHIDLPQWCFCCFFVFWSFGKIFSCYKTVRWLFCPFLHVR
jgi:hypothetical protein